MRGRNKLPELLAPAGDMRALCAAVMAGADAVYVGGRSFGARAFAKNFDIDELSRAVEYCHLYGVRLYVTVNTLVFDRELSDLCDYIIKLWQIGVDAIIAADLGVISLIRECAPGLEIHASTQASVHSTGGAVALHSLGCTRVVPARELSLENIRSMVENSPTEIEVFLHGALCVCHSGQCLMSSMLGGRSGNRGECAQPCRLPYNNGKPILSLKDLSLAGHIRALIDSGVASLKIEGRMKSAEYVYEVTKIYRTLLDEGRCAEDSERARLAAAFSRGGFTDGYFVGKTERGMTGVRSQSDKDNSRAIGVRDFSPISVRATARVELQLGKPSSMTLSVRDRSVTVTGAIPTAAINSPLTREGVCDRLSKTGGTFISLSREDISLTLDEGINLSPAQLNALRREAISTLTSCKREMPAPTPCSVISEKRGEKPLSTAQFFSAEAYFELKKRYPSALSDIDIAFIPLADAAKCGSVGAYLPPVITDSEEAGVRALLGEARDAGVKYVLVSNVGQIALATEYGFCTVGDFRLNVTNSRTRAEYERLGVSHIILSPELTLPMARDIGGGVITLGRLPLMLTERCFIKDNFGCDRCNAGKATLVDRTGARFPIIREREHRNIIFNSTLTYMGDKRGELVRAGITHRHFIFSVESADEINSYLLAYRKGAPLGTRVRRLGMRE